MMQNTAAIAPKRANGPMAHGGHIRDPIDIESEARPTPATLRHLRMKAGLTKSEAAHVVGLGGRAASWHQYELGRYAIPSDKWAEFIKVLRSGRYPSTCFSSSRRGPRSSDEFEVGRMAAAAPKRASIDSAACVFVSTARQHLRLSAAELASNLGVELHRVYRIESVLAGPTDIELAKCRTLVEEHVRQLLNPKDLDNVDLATLRGTYLRVSSTEAARLAGLKGSRPGATWSALESGARADDKAIARFRRAVAAARLKRVESLESMLTPT